MTTQAQAQSALAVLSAFVAERPDSGTPPTQPPTEPPTQPPTQPPSTNGQFIGDLAFTGARKVTQGIMGQPFNYARIVIPSGYDGKIAPINFSEYIDPQRSKTVTLSKVVGDFSAPWPGLGYGSSGHITVAFGTPRQGCVTVKAGETWYFNCIYRTEGGTLTAKATDSANYQITCAMPA